MIRRMAVACLCSMTWTTAVAEERRYGLYRSTDGGASWAEASAGPPAHVRTGVLAAAADTSFAGTHEGLYVSRDSGRTWKRDEGLPAARVTALTVGGERVFAATAEGLFVSPDGGRSWRASATAMAKARVRSLLAHRGRVWAGTDGRGVYVLDAGAADWRPIAAGLPDGAQVLALTPQGDTVVAGLYAKGVYRQGPSEEWTSAGPARAFRVHAAGDRLYAGLNGGGGGVLISDTPGTWVRSSGGLPEHSPIWAFADLGRSLLVGTSGPAAAYRTDTAGLLWTPSARGLPDGSSVLAFGVAPELLLAAVLY